MANDTPRRLRSTREWVALLEGRWGPKTFSVKVIHADEPGRDHEYHNEPITSEWCQWPWLEWAKSIIEHPDFHKLCYVVGLVRIEVKEESSAS